MYQTAKIKNLLLLNIAFVLLCGCQKSNESSMDYKTYEFVLVDSLRMNIPVEPHFVELKASNEKMLLYSIINKTFYVINKKGEVLLEHNRIGEGPGFYDKTVYQAGLRNGQLIIQDVKKIFTYSSNGEFLNDQRYQPSFLYSSSGNIKNGIKFLRDSLILNPLAFTGIVMFKPNKLTTIDTIKTIELINTKSGHIYNSPLAVEFEPESIYKQGLVYPKFLPLMDVSLANSILISYPYEQRLYEYELVEGQLKLKNKSDFKLDQFKTPRGVKEEDLTQMVNPIISKNAGLNSSILKIFGKENNETFILYSTGVPDRYASEQALGPYYKESKLLGGLVKNGQLISSGIEIPNNGFAYMNEYQMSYWGNNQWAFIQDNEEEHNYYRLYIYELLPVD